MQTYDLTGIQHRTAAAFVKLALLRGIACECYWDTESSRYVVNGEPLGESIESAQAWLDKQPGVDP